jgi:2-keto-3-deoxy-L-rhamnonate aldolase RhmA
VADGLEVAGFRQRVLAGEVLTGTFLNLGSALAAEIAALSGFDWLVIDLEHGAGGETEALGQLHAVGGTPVCTIVRVESLARPRVHRVLDLGAAGVLVPRLEGVEDARRAVEYSRYGGLRGVAFGNRSRHWGRTTRAELARADDDIVCAVQIETVSALADAREIAAVDGVDIVFVGPADLAHALGVDGGADNPDVLVAARVVAAAAAESGKAAGVLVDSVEHADLYRSIGFSFIGCGTDGTLLARQARTLVENLRARLLEGVDTVQVEGAV